MKPSPFRSQRLTCCTPPLKETYVFAPASSKVPWRNASKPAIVHTLLAPVFTAEDAESAERVTKSTAHRTALRRRSPALRTDSLLIPILRALCGKNVRSSLMEIEAVER